MTRLMTCECQQAMTDRGKDNYDDDIASSFYCLSTIL